MRILLGSGWHTAAATHCARPGSSLTRSAASERVDSSSVLVSEGLLIPPPQPSFPASATVFFSSAPPRGSYRDGPSMLVMIRYASRITSEDDRIVSSLKNPNYVGSVNFLLTLPWASSGHVTTQSGDLSPHRRLGRSRY